MSEVTAKDLRELIQHYAPPHLVDAELAAFDAMAEKAELLDRLEKMYSCNYDEFQRFMEVFTAEENQPNQYGSIIEALKAVPE